jgi:Ser/Thr protein kinase RdoA (MazF antagonist)
VRAEVSEQLRFLTAAARRRGTHKTSFNTPTLVHGDLQAANILCDRDSGEIVAFVDFDSVVRGPTIWALARACAFLFEARPADCAAFLSGYISYSPVSNEEIAAFADVLEDYLLCGTWSYDQMVKTGKLVSSHLRRRAALHNSCLERDELLSQLKSLGG